MSQIDIQNAKQIRDSMQVIITMDVPESVSTSYGNYTNVKVYDTALRARAWPMRKLADLQGDGFPLDGSRLLYDSSVTASLNNGKLGIRGDVGATISFTVTATDTVQGLTIAATGTDSVTYNGETAMLSDGQAIIPINSSSVTISMDPADADTRVEVSLVQPGTSLQITNDSLISCTVSLRSDLSADNPTLPESELNVEAYNDADISEMVASIPEETAITYTAGYAGDMSPLRKFYVSGKVTWENNVLTINAVDAVHFLDVDFGPYWIGSAGNSINKESPSVCGDTILGLIRKAGVSPSVQTETLMKYQPGWNMDAEYIPRGNCRELVAYANNVLKFKDLPNKVFYTSNPSGDYWFTYVDAGRPTISTKKRTISYSIDESDCAELTRNVDSPIKQINVTHTKGTAQEFATVGSVSWGKDEWTAFPQFDKLTFSIIAYGYRDVSVNGTKHHIQGILPVDAEGWHIAGPKTEAAYLVPIIDDESLQNIASANNSSIIYTQVVPSNAPFNANDSNYLWTSQSAAWSGLVSANIISSNDTTADLEIIGSTIEPYAEELSYTNANVTGRTIDIEERFHGNLYFGDTNHELYGEAYPTMAFNALLERSNIAGSFIWKGDPRMQPRDLVTFNRLDGTSETITLENITLHHENGGTYAEITYRKGVC